MKALTFIKWALLGVTFGVLMTACGGDDKKESKSSEYVEINGICFERDREIEVSRSRCYDEDSPAYYTQNNRCYNYDNDDRVNDRECDLAYQNRSLGNGLTYNYQNGQAVRCGIMQDHYYGQLIDCSASNVCSGQFLRDPNTGQTVLCQ